MTEVTKSTSIMQYVLYAVLAVVVLTGLFSIMGGSGGGSSAPVQVQEPMF